MIKNKIGFLQKKGKGFTLIELLIVIAIIAILAAAIIVGINPARYFRQARDSTRLRHMETIATAVYGYAIEHYGDYPSECIGDEGIPDVIYPDPPPIADCGLPVGTESWCALVVPIYLREAPVDPLECYFYQIDFLGESDAPVGIRITSQAPETWLDRIVDPALGTPLVSLTK